MPHDIFGERFLSRRVPAWHNLGQVVEEDLGAVPALRRLGEPVVTKEPLYSYVNGAKRTLMFQGIWRHPTQDDPEYRCFGVVGPDYNLITAGDVCTVWDEFVAQPVETMGFLAMGAKFFITSRLPAYDVRGDEVENYLGAVAPLDGATAATCEVWPVRVVCQNTLRLAQEQATTTYRVHHTQGAPERMGTWLADMYREAEAMAMLQKEAFTHLAGVTTNDEGARWVATKAYPEPPRPRQDAPRDVVEARTERWEYARGRVRVYRDGALRLFKGEGRGQGPAHRATNGTLWGVYNAVAEAENYRKGWNRDGQEDSIVSEAVMFGSRGRTIQRAYDACMELAQDRAATIELMGATGA